MAYVSEDGGFKLLAKAIVLQAAEDYGNALLGRIKSNGRFSPVHSKSMVEDCRRFFMSEKLALYTKVPGETIMQKVEEDIKTWPKRKNYSLGKLI